MDLSRAHAAVQELIISDIESIIESAVFVNGPCVTAFEAEFAEYCGASHCVGVSSGLDALRLALIASGVETGDVRRCPRG